MITPQAAEPDESGGRHGRSCGTEVERERLGVERFGEAGYRRDEDSQPQRLMSGPETVIDGRNITENMPTRTEYAKAAGDASAVVTLIEGPGRA